MVKKHIAKSGAHAGDWVVCSAKQQCRNGGKHVSGALLKETKKFMSESYGINIPVSRVREQDIRSFSIFRSFLNEGDNRELYEGGIERIKAYRKNPVAAKKLIKESLDGFYNTNTSAQSVDTLYKAVVRERKDYRSVYSDVAMAVYNDGSDARSDTPQKVTLRALKLEFFIPDTLRSEKDESNIRSYVK